MYTLFIDTHYKDVLLYLYKDNDLIGKKEVFDVKNTSVEAMPSLISLINNANITKKDLDKIAVCIGPGSFTGTRIGVTIAKTLAYSLNIPICTLSSLDLVGLNLENKSYVGVLENNGAFVCLYDKKVISDIKYLKQSEYEEFKNNNNLVDKIELNHSKLINFINNLDSINSFDVNPLYVKNIEGLK